mgnify:CR=1 FL=1
MVGAIMRDMITRQIQALAAGTCIAVIVQESIWIALDLLDPRQSLNDVLGAAPLSDGWLVPLLLAWIGGGLFGGLMATLVGRSRYTGHAAGLLLSASAALLAWHALPGAGGFLVVAATPAIGTAIGTSLALKVDGAADRHEKTPPTSIAAAHSHFH